MNPTQSKSNKTDSSGMTTNSEQDGNRYKLPPSIKIIPTTASIRSISVADNDFFAREFITLCEDVIKGSSITEDANKISFIRSKFVLGSRALNLVQSGAFSRTYTGSDYEQFKRKFLKVFGENR